MKNQPIKTDERGTAFLIDKLASELLPYQYLRELVQNSIEAEATRVEVGTFWPMVESDGVYKLSVADNGCGMTPEEMYKYLGKLASSGKRQGMRDNFGIGAKVAALASSPAGLTYMSWKDGKGYGITLLRDGDEYAIHRYENGEYAIPLPDTAKPYVIEDHGTVVVLIGNSHDETTTRPDSGKSYWLPIYFNNRYWNIPANVAISLERLPVDRNEWPLSMMRDAGKGDTWFITAKGFHKHLTDAGMVHGQVKIPGACVNWYLDVNAGVSSSTSHGYLGQTAIGRTGIIWRSEIYETTLMPGTIQRQQLFGIAAGNAKIAILVEPDDDLVETNAARTRLRIDGDNPPWEEWGNNFRAAMPDELRDFILQELSKGTKGNKDEIDKRVREIMRITNRSHRFKPDPEGDKSADGAAPGGFRGLLLKMVGNGGKVKDPTKRRENGSILDAYLNELSDDGQSSRQISDGVVVPRVMWMLANADNDLEDRAARYDKTSHLVIANEGFRLFVDMVGALCEEHQHQKAEVVAWTIVRSWYETALCETVVRVNAMMSGKAGQLWNQDDLALLLSPEGLTASVMSAYLIHRQASAEMATRMRKIIMLPERMAA